MYERIMEIVNDNLPEGPFDIASEAERIRSIMEREDPVLLARWERDLSIGALSASLREILRKQRSTQRRIMTKRKTQDQIREAVETGRLTPFQQRVCVGNREWKPVGQLTAGDLEILAQDYQSKATYARLEAHFYLELSRRVGTKTVEQALTEEEYVGLYNNVRSGMHA